MISLHLLGSFWRTNDLKINVQERRIGAEEDKEGILEWSAQIEERMDEFEKAINDIE